MAGMFQPKAGDKRHFNLTLAAHAAGMDLAAEKRRPVPSIQRISRLGDTVEKGRAHKTLFDISCMPNLNAQVAELALQAQQPNASPHLVKEATADCQKVIERSEAAVSELTPTTAPQFTF